MGGAYEQLAGIIKALGHPARLHILDVLSRGEACVCHLTTILQRRQPYVSQQLMILRKAGLVRVRRDGPVVYYRLADEHVVRFLEDGRDLLRARGEAGAFPEIPAPPVEGCPCPKCAQGRP